MLEGGWRAAQMGGPAGSPRLRQSASGFSRDTTSPSSALRQRAETCTMTQPTSKKQGFKKCRSATFSIDGFSFTIVANKAGESNRHPLAQLTRSRSQNVLCTNMAACTGSSKRTETLVDTRSTEEILADELPVPEEPDALESAAIRLRCLVKQLDKGEASLVDLKKNLEYAASVLEFLYTEETRRMVDLEDELSDIPSDSVPSEVRNWLASTFTRRKGLAVGCNEDKLRFRSIVHAVQAGIFVDRMYRRSSHMAALSYPPGVVTELKHVDKWSFDVFALNDASGDHSLKFVLYELLTRYDLISRFKIPVSALISFVDSLEVGYSKHKNPYHNLIHAADVTQTIHYLLLKTGMLHWLSELEIFATIFAAAIHDYEHTGTTNNFHVQTRSDISLLYNDHAVLENHHVSAVYRLLQNNDEVNILSNLSKDDWRELRSLVVEMVLATDMSCHFEQIKVMKSLLQQPDAIDKAKALSLLLHTADISHPAKPWSLHHRWTFSLLEEFFRQGDKEAELGLPFSPLCDRKSTMVAQSQIGFIDFIVEPTFTVMTEMIEKIMTPLMEEACLLGLDGFRRSSVNSISCSDGKSTKSDGSCSLASVDFNSFKATWIREVHQNKETWRSQAAKELEEDAQRCQHKNGIKEEKFIRKLLNVTDKILEMKSDRQKEKQENEGGARDPGSDVQLKQQTQKHNRPSYCAGSYGLFRIKVSDFQPIDARAKARKLQNISLRYRKRL
ncbi:dual specificity calcium/calmodulin-dependent 3',5'-cyclic nucleotide phosphodiesterase 1A isoform X1 [Takifugu flavidus]|uniref:dual specificity calcium/calmodulin-dependent 3',5'-cyclic nucleotide phosphodiesterase 1A isoform X1 n=1 Tax=Takifugu flavidus TaxID=433684 RepID=UPI0025449A81|nr:dual specificity calcium/calmodulin-dependent 3',5'-cyclic nucleotide phosphodiesterase 1A isoform X1 [Takifugu flavidus]